MTKAWKHFVGGEFLAPDSEDYLTEFDPKTGREADQIARGNAVDVDMAVNNANEAQPAWEALKPVERGRILLEIARLIRRKAPDLAEVEAKETGKPRKVAMAEVELAAQYFEFYGGLATSIHGAAINMGPDYHTYTRREAFGVIGVILPWNSPLNQGGRAIAPALAAGNTVVVKPSEFTSISTVQLADLMVKEAGLPSGVINVVTGNGKEVGEPLVRHPVVRKVVFTGSVRAGREIGHIAAERIIPLTLELGGKSPNVVFEDADLDKAVPGSVLAFTINTGQVCLAGTRCLVQASIYDEFAKRIAAEVRRIQQSDGDSPGLGPLTTKAQYERVAQFYETARQEGATALVGGDLPAGGEGWYVTPTVYTNVKPGTRVMREEIFGPVLAMLRFEDEDEAIRIANDTEYGLVAGIWTNNLSRAHRVAAKLQAGQVFVNQYPAGGVETPFGGYKQSGYGREKGLEALAHYTQSKTVIIRL
jgi:aldehyde dehydrogenase (NAD+)